MATIQRPTTKEEALKKAGRLADENAALRDRVEVLTEERDELREAIIKFAQITSDPESVAVCMKLQQAGLDLITFVNRVM